jgi:hypothetical protein
MAFLGFGKKDKSTTINFPTIPAWADDPLFGKTQDELYDFGSNLLAGKPNDYYKSIGETGGQAFEDVVRMTNRDIERSALELAAKTGAPGGAVLSAVSKATADVTKQLRWEDLVRANEGKVRLLGAGLDTVGGVSGRSLQYMGAKNNYALGKAQIESSQASQQAELDAKNKAAKTSMWSNILSSAVGAASNIYGMNTIAKAFMGAAGGSKGTSNIADNPFALATIFA